jgi:DNA-directed RNA polymerase subunit RPC12/RpoP
MNIEFKCLKCKRVSVKYDASEFDIQCPKCRSWEIKPLRPVPYPERYMLASLR